MITVSFKQGSTDPNSSVPEGQGVLISRNINYRMSNYPNKWCPPVDIYEIQTHIIVLIEIAGVSEEDISVTFDKNTLSISGVRPFPVEERRAVHQIEIPFGEFSCEITLPSAIETDKIEATYRNGFLRIDLPKSKPQQIQVQVSEG